MNAYQNSAVLKMLPKGFFVLRILKITKFQKQIILFSILPKNERKSSILVYQATRIEDFRSFFGRTENKEICF